MPTEDWYHQIHERLLAEDPTAPAELVEVLLDLLIEKLTIIYPNLRASELLSDAVIDALMSYIKEPAQFHPSKRGLFGFLVMAAKGDLLNALAKIKRRKTKETLLENVEVEELAGKKVIENQESKLNSKRTLQDMLELFDNPMDRRLLELILQGERSTEAFVPVLGIEELPPDEKRRLVKRHKDRIKKRLERYRRKIYEEGR